MGDTHLPEVDKCGEHTQSRSRHVIRTRTQGAENLRILTLSGVVAAEGGIPLLIEGKIVGAIGASGMTSAQDNQCAKAGADSLK